MSSTVTRLYLTVVASSLAVLALPWDGPAPTVPARNPLGFTPKPTEAAVLAFNDLFALPKVDLLQRQVGVDTCGFIEKSLDNPYTCDTGYACVSNKINNNWGCCGDSHSAIKNCRLFTSCIPKTLLPEACDKDCQTNPFINFCTSSGYTECVTVFNVFPTATLSAVLCDSITGRYTIYDDYRGDTTSTPFEISGKNRVTKNTIPGLTFYTPPSASSPSSSTSSTSTQPHAHPAPNGVGLPGKQGGSDDNGGSSTNVGAIAGGVVGGVAVLAAFVGAVVWMCLRNRRREREAATVVPPDTSENRGYPNPGLAPPQQYNQPINPPMTQPATGNYGDGTYFGPGQNDAYDSSVNKTHYSPSPAATSPLAGNTEYGQKVPGSGDGTIDSQPPILSMPVEADSAPVLTTADGRPIHEISSSN